jgi:hypothetical protein
MAFAVIAAVSTLAAMGVITGQEALPVIAAAGGFTLGGTVGSQSLSTGTGSTAGDYTPAATSTSTTALPTPPATPTTPKE